MSTKSLQWPLVEPTIQPDPTSTQEATPEDERGDLFIRGLFNCILDVHVTDTYAKSYIVNAFQQGH
jgi:hypothetical protein